MSEFNVEVEIRVYPKPESPVYGGTLISSGRIAPVGLSIDLEKVEGASAAEAAIRGLDQSIGQAAQLLGVQVEGPASD